MKSYFPAASRFPARTRLDRQPPGPELSQWRPPPARRSLQPPTTTITAAAAAAGAAGAELRAGKEPQSRPQAPQLTPNSGGKESARLPGRRCRLKKATLPGRGQTARPGVTPARRLRERRGWACGAAASRGGSGPGGTRGDPATVPGRGERSSGPPQRHAWSPPRCRRSGSSYRGRAAGQCRGGGRPGPGGEAAPSTPREAGAAGPFPPPSLLPPL